MRSLSSGITGQRVARLTCLLLLGLPASIAQTTGNAIVEAPEIQQAALLLPPDQLNNLVAPVALYPDPLLSQVLSASTYPLEIVQAHQWLSRNGNLQGAQLMEAAKQQNWDPSVQAMVAFPNALALLANDIRWTTDLGNAFLAQQADVMSAVQTMRAQARASGKLTTTPQQVVTVATQGNQEAIEILPADPQVIYVPIYRPSYVWGPPAWGVYPDVWYPSGFSLGFGFGPGYYMNSFYPSWGGWGGWGWNCGWFGGGLNINVGFFNRYGYYGGGYGGYGGYYGGRGYGGRAAWAHNPSHRWGVPYPNRAVSNRYGGDRRGGGNYAGGNYNGGTRGGGSQWTGGRSDSGRQGPSGSGQWQRFGDGNRTQSAGRSVTSGFARSGDSGSSWSTRGGTGSYSAPRTSTGMRDSGRGGYSTSGSYSAPRTSTGMRDSGRGGYSTSGSYSAPRTSTGMRDSGRGGYSTSGSYSAPRTSTGMRDSGRSGYSTSGSYSAPRTSTGMRDSGRSGFSAPRSSMGSSPSFSSPRSSSGGGGFGGGSGFSGGRVSGGGGSGFSGGRSGGGGGGSFSGGRSGGGGGSMSGGRSGGGGGGGGRGR